MTDVIPTPIDVPILIIKNSSDITNRTAASSSAPNPAIQNKSMILYNDISLIDGLRGNANFSRASFGFPLSKFTILYSN